MSDPDLIRALSDLTLAVRGGLQMTTRSASSSDMFLPFESSITGSGTFDVWTPASTTRYILRGFSITAVVREALLPGATAAGHFRFVDSGTTNPIVPVASYGATGSASAAIDFLLTGLGPVVNTFADGIPGSALGTKLQLDCSNNINGGVIRFCGIVWGNEEPR